MMQNTNITLRTASKGKGPENEMERFRKLKESHRPQKEGGKNEVKKKKRRKTKRGKKG